jgi:drug/metabolite transporter (DMT)-like permease
MTEQRTRLAAIAAFVALCIIWSSTWLAIKLGLRDLPPISFVALRFIIAVVVLLAISVGRVPLLPRDRGDFKLLAWTGVLMFAINYALPLGGALCFVGVVRCLAGNDPISEWCCALHHPERTAGRRIAGAVLAIGGVAVICSRLLISAGLAFWGGVAMFSAPQARHSRMCC